MAAKSRVEAEGGAAGCAMSATKPDLIRNPAAVTGKRPRPSPEPRPSRKPQKPSLRRKAG